MLLRAAVAVDDGRREKHDAFENEHQDCQRGPILRPVNLPASSPTSEHGVEQAVGSVQNNQRDDSEKYEAISNVIEDVVTGFVTEDEERLLRSQLLNGVVENHDAVGCAEAGNIRVNFVVFAAGIHQKHAITGDLQAGASGDVLQVGSQVRMLVC